MMPFYYPCFADSEWKPLKAVLIHSPSPLVAGVKDHEKALFSRQIDHGKIAREFRCLEEAYKGLGIKVLGINADEDMVAREGLYNLMYARDLFFATPMGAIISNMRHAVRSHEPRHAKEALASKGASIKSEVHGQATFEGADALWVDEGLVAIGVGKRTNIEGFTQVRDALMPFGIRCVPLPAPSGTLHLLGALQFADRGLAILRREIVDVEVIKFLRRMGFDVIALPEDREVSEAHAMNLVCVAPRSIVMPEGFPSVEAVLMRRGINIKARVPASEITAGGGGIACATGILRRAH